MRIVMLALLLASCGGSGQEDLANVAGCSVEYSEAQACYYSLCTGDSEACAGCPEPEETPLCSATR